MGEYIKKLRTGNNKYGKKMTQGELGAALNPPVKRAAVNKWESGMNQNIKIQYIQQMANIFGITTTELMCFDNQIDFPKDSEEVNVIEQVQSVLNTLSEVIKDKEFIQLFESYRLLNDKNKQIVKRLIEDLKA